MLNRVRAILGLHFVDNLEEVFSHSGSFWCQVIGLVVMIMPEAIFGFFDIDTNPVFWYLAGFFLLVAGTVGRVLKQDRRPWVERARVALVILVALLAAFVLSGRAIAAEATEEQTLKIAVPLIAASEGERLHAYIPMKGDVPTIGYGHTEGVHIGMTITHEQAWAMLWEDVTGYRTRLHRFFTPVTLKLRLPATRDAAYTSLGYNCGPETIGRSTAVKRLNAGDIKGGCHAITWWSKMGTILIRGLFNRRKKEEALCLIGA